MKRTKDLTPEEILAFQKKEFEHWMNRVMNRLYKLLEGGHEYKRLAREFVHTCRGGIEFAKKGLIQLVRVIQEKWTEPTPSTHLKVVQ
jgi:hypothetical protein